MELVSDLMPLTPPDPERGKLFHCARGECELCSQVVEGRFYGQAYYCTCRCHDEGAPE